MSGKISEPQSIERDLEQTRSRLDGHLSELRGRLTPGQVVDDLLGYFRGKEGAEFGRNLVDSVRGNPLPAALTGIGLTWLMASNPRPAAGATSQPAGSSRVRIYPGLSPDLSPGLSSDLSPRVSSEHAAAARVRAAEQTVIRTPGEAEASYSGRLDAARAKALGLVQDPQESAGSFSQRLRDALGSAKQSGVESAHDLRDRAGQAVGSLGSMAQGAAGSLGDAAQRGGGLLADGGRAAGQAGSNLITTLTESPVLLGALGLAAGALLGALLPQSDQEEAALGGVAGRAREGARDLAQEVMDRGGHVAQAVVDKGRDSAGAAGLTGNKSAGELVDAAMSGNLAESAKKVAEDVLHTGDQAIRKEAGT